VNRDIDDQPSGSSTSSSRYKTPPRKRAWIFLGSGLEPGGSVLELGWDLALVRI